MSSRDFTYSRVQVNDRLAAKQDVLGYTPENTANRVSNFSVVNQTTYPNTQAVYDLVSSITGGGVLSVSGTVPISVTAGLNPVVSLSASGVAAGTYGSASSVAALTVDAYGRATTVTDTAIQVAESQVTGLVADLAAKQPLDATLTALAAYNTNGLLTQTAADTFVGRTLTGTSNRLTVTNGDGVAGAPTFDISSSYVGQATITTLGTIATGVWSGTRVGLAYGGTNADLSATGGTSQYLKQASVGAAVTVGTIPASDIASGAALTKTDDTNVTLTLGGAYTTALLAASSLTLGWTGQLSVARGGTGAATLTGVLRGNGTSAFTAATDADITGKVLTGYTSGAGTVSATDTLLQAIQKLNGNVSGLTTGVSSVFGRTGAVTATSGDYSTNLVTENTNLYFTNARGIASTLTGYVSGAGTVSSSDSILQAIQKLNGNDATNANLTGPITSVGNATSIASQTGTGTTFVMNTSPTLVTPLLGTPTSGVLTNCTGTASGLTAGNVTTNANLTGEVTSVGNAATLTNSAVIGKVLTGYTSGAGTVAATDTILQAFQKLNGNISTLYVPYTGATADVSIGAHNYKCTGYYSSATTAEATAFDFRDSTLRGTTLAYTAFGWMAGNSSTSIDIEHINTSTAAGATVDHTTYMDDSTHYGGFGQTSKNYNVSGSSAFTAYCQYLYSQLDDIVVGTYGTGKKIYFNTDGGNTAQTRMALSSAGVHVYGATAYGVVCGPTASNGALQSTAAGTLNYILTGNGSALPTFQNLGMQSGSFTVNSTTASTPAASNAVGSISNLSAAPAAVSGSGSVVTVVSSTSAIQCTVGTAGQFMIWCDGNMNGAATSPNFGYQFYYNTVANEYEILFTTLSATANPVAARGYGAIGAGQTVELKWRQTTGTGQRTTVFAPLIFHWIWKPS